jgi:hypothetical protein
MALQDGELVAQDQDPGGLPRRAGRATPLVRAVNAILGTHNMVYPRSTAGTFRQAHQIERSAGRQEPVRMFSVT